MQLIGTGSHRTTIDTDVLDGWDAIRAEISRRSTDGADVPVLACSSAGGGLRIAVVGNEELVTSEAGRRVALSSGGRVVHVSYDAVDLDALRASEPDVVLLVGGTDGGNAEVLLANAHALAKGRWSGPVVRGRQRGCRRRGRRGLRHRRRPVRRRRRTSYRGSACSRPTVRAPRSARCSSSHVIGGKHLSARTDFTAMVQGATPDVVLTAVELLAAGLGDRSGPGAGDVVVVDVGGATTDVHSVVEVDPEESGLAPRGGGDGAGQPDRRGRSRYALERRPDRRGRS